MYLFDGTFGGCWRRDDTVYPRRSETEFGVATGEKDFATAGCDTEFGGLGGGERGGSNCEFREIDGRSRSLLRLESHADDIEGCNCATVMSINLIQDEKRDIPSNDVNKLPDMADTIFCVAVISTTPLLLLPAPAAGIDLLPLRISLPSLGPVGSASIIWRSENSSSAWRGFWW